LKKLIFILVVLFSLPTLGQEGNPTAVTQFYLQTFLSTDRQNVSSDLSFDSFLKKLEKKRISIKKEKDFVRYVFAKTHHAYLKKFESFASFNGLFENGTYNCLTGTILYAIILNHFNISHEVIETNYHIFITVNTKQGKILLEATDPLNGFVESAHDIESRIATYKQNTLTASNSKSTYFQFNFDLFNHVSMEELRGLLYYNKAVDSFNHHQLEESIQFLVEAHTLYASSRVNEFSMILSLAVQQSTWDVKQKEKYLRVIYSISEKNSLAIASIDRF
jgi:hypothetical protein